MHQVNSDRGLEGLQCSRCNSEISEKMFDWDGEWNISFAGCGFRSIYYLGALSCIFQRAPQLLYGASKICGASSGCLVAAALTVGIPIEEFCVDVLSLAKEARKHTLGVFHPTFSLLRAVRDSLQEKLPADAHFRASGRLCVSLTRLADGQNILVSEFDSRDELIQVLMCSCFFPVYCGFTPPQYRGVRYMDGALSNNMPLFEQSNTITLAPFSGESDICPREGTFNFLEVTYGNVSIQVNTANVHRVCTSFLPTKPQKLAEICNNGYVDALRFLRERDLLGTQQPPPSLGTDVHTVEACCERAKSAQAKESKKTLVNGQGPHLEDHRWLDLRVIEDLPLSFKRVLCEACRDSHDGGRLLPVKVLLCLLTYLMLPIELMVSLLRSLVLSVCRLLTSTTGLCGQMRSNSWKNPNSAFPERYSSSSPDKNMTHRPNQTLHWDNNGNLDLLLSLKPSRAGLSDFQTHNKLQCEQVALHCRRKSMHHQP